jgi:hypothetical protein
LRKIRIVIVAGGGAGAAAMLKATRTIPIVFVITPDPVDSGFVASLSHPGGNATSFAMFEYDLCGKWLELRHEIAPKVRMRRCFAIRRWSSVSVNSPFSSRWRHRSVSYLATVEIAGARRVRASSD